MATGISANRLELLQIADAVAREKSIDKQVVIAAMEEAMERAAKSRFGAENEIKVEIDPKTGETHTSRYLHVVDEVDNTKTEISVVDARVRNPAAQAGDIIAETLPPIEFSRRPLSKLLFRRFATRNVSAITRNIKIVLARSYTARSNGLNLVRWLSILDAPRALYAAMR